MELHHISAEHLSVGRVREILEKHLRLALSDDARRRIVRCREYLDRKMENPERPIYGITTGFGSLCNISVGRDDLAALQKNLVMSHACGTGERVPAEVVRLILLLKIQSLSYGHSGVQLATVERLIDFFNNDILPVIYQQGSLGASGDLAPLAHMSLPLLGLGEVEFKGQLRPASEVLAETICPACGRTACTSSQKGSGRPSKASSDRAPMVSAHSLSRSASITDQTP